MVGNDVSLWLPPVTRAATLQDDAAAQSRRRDMSWALNEFFAAIEEEFGVPIGEADDAYLETPGSVIDYLVENTEPTDGMDGEEYREHVAGVVGEIMARTLGITRYSESSRFVQDLHIR